MQKCYRMYISIKPESTQRAEHVFSQSSTRLQVSDALSLALASAAFLASLLDRATTLNTGKGLQLLGSAKPGLLRPHSFKGSQDLAFRRFRQGLELHHE